MSAIDETETVPAVGHDAGEKVIGGERALPPTEMNTSPLLEEEVTGLSMDAGEHVKSLDQATLFRAVDEGHLDSVQALLRNRKVDVNAYNDEGVTAIFLAVYRYENHRDTRMAQLLLSNGASVSAQAATPPSAHKLSIVRHDQKHPHGEVLLETRKVSLDHKRPLQVALELKSSLYLRGWEYRHWDDLINLLAAAQVNELEGRSEVRTPPLAAIPASVRLGWVGVFRSGAHDLVELWAEGHYVVVLKELLIANSKILKFNLESATALGSERLELKEASFAVTKVIAEFLYTGNVDPEFVERRGIDLFNAAHAYGLESLKQLCEAAITCTPDNWIKVLAAANNGASDTLTLKCAKAIHGAMDKRMDHLHFDRPVFAENIHPDGGPVQLSDPFVRHGA